MDCALGVLLLALRLGFMVVLPSWLFCITLLECMFYITLDQVLCPLNLMYFFLFNLIYFRCRGYLCAYLLKNDLYYHLN